MIHKIKKEVSDNKKYIYFGYLVSILTMIPQLIAAPSLSDSRHIIFLFLVLIMLFFITKFSKLLFTVFIIYLNISNIIIGHIFLHWGYAQPSIQARLDVAVISPAYETYEYLKSYIDYKDIILIIYTIFILFLLFKYISNFKHSFKILKFLGFIFSIAIITLVSLRENPLKVYEPFSIPYKYHMSKYYSILPIERKKYLDSLKMLSIDKKLSYDKIVFIQGEAVNKHYMSIYGYEKNTTPFFSKLKSEKKLYIFNAIAPTNQTRYSVSILNTKATVHNFKDAYVHSRGLVGKIKDFGYKTYWISNQGEAGKHDTLIASMSREADIQKFWNVQFTTSKPDKVIVDYLNKIKDNTNKEMYMIHLMGSHDKYTSRYTKDISLFKNPINIQEEYDNTIYYTDYIIKQIFNKFKNQKVLIIYASDHGELISENRHGHGFSLPCKDEYIVPFVIYSSIPNKRIEELFSKNKKGYFNLENLNYMIEYISEVSDDLNISYSSDVFSMEPKYIYNYDELSYGKEIYNVVK